MTGAYLVDRPAATEPGIQPVALSGHGPAVVLAVHISEDSSTMRDHSDRVGLTFPMIAAADTRIASAYRFNGIPAHFFIDKSVSCVRGRPVA